MGRGVRALALIALACLLPACSGGGGGGGGPTAPTPTPGITLAPATATPPGVVLARGAASTTTTLVLEVRASQVTGLYGVAFDLQYPADLLHFQAFRQGTFLASGSSVSAQVFESSPGHLVVGLSRIGPVAGVAGSGVLVELDLTAVAAGNGSLTYSNNAAYASDGNQLALSWAAGSVSVVR